MYAVGGFDFPTSTGTKTVSGLGFSPKAVIMMGGNRPEVDSLVTGRQSPGVFLSLSARRWGAPSTIDQLSFAIAGRSLDGGRGGYRGIETVGCISMPVDGTNLNVVDYRAGVMSFGADGFSFPVTQAATGRRPIHWWAIGGTDVGCDAFWSATNGTFANAYRPLSSLVLSHHGGGKGAFSEGAINGLGFFSVGTGHFPELATNVSQWHSGLTYSHIAISSAVGRQGFLDMFNINGGAPPTSHVLSAVGPAYIEGFRRHRPNALGSTTMINEGGGSPVSEHAIWWGGEGTARFIGVPTAGGTSVETPPAYFNATGSARKWDVVMFTTANGPIPRTAGSAQQRYGFGLIGPDYQGCVAFGDDGSFYQSATKCVANCSVAGAEAASGEILPSGALRLTGEVGNGFANVMLHGWGSPAPASPWVPQIYRRLPG